MPDLTWPELHRVVGVGDGAATLGSGLISTSAQCPVCALRASGLWLRDHEGMKRSTAVGRLSDVADELDRVKQWSDVSVIAGHVYGALVDGDDELERVSSCWSSTSLPTVCRG